MIMSALQRLVARLTPTDTPTLIGAADALQQAQLDRDAVAEAAALREYEDALRRVAGVPCCCDDSLIGLELSDRTVFFPDFTRASR